MDTRTKSVPATDIRAVVSQFRQLSREKQEGGERYRLDRLSAEAYMDVDAEFRKKVYHFLRTLRGSGEKVVYVDICGRAKLDWADANYSFSLQENYWKSDQIPERFVGDLFSAKDFYGFLRMLRNNGHRPSFVTCEPVAGLNEYTVVGYKKTGPYEEVLYQRLENNLRAMIKLLRPGGFIFLSRVRQGEGFGEFLAHIPPEKRKATLFMKALCKSMRCSVDMSAWHGGTPNFLIRKWLR